MNWKKVKESNMNPPWGTIPSFTWEDTTSIITSLDLNTGPPKYGILRIGCYIFYYKTIFVFT